MNIAREPAAARRREICMSKYIAWSIKVISIAMVPVGEEDDNISGT
jgi:hypothetical protein